MANNNLVILVLHLVLVATVLLTVLHLRPALARVTAQRDVLQIRDNIVDCMLAGDIDRDNPRARRVVEFCEFIAENAKSLKLSDLIATMNALRSAGVDYVAEAKETAETSRRESKGMATEAGEACLDQSETEIDHVLSRYLIRGSSLWFILSPAQRFNERQRRHEARQIQDTIHQPTPGQLAKEMRESAGDQHPWWWTDKEPPKLTVAGV